MEYKIKDKELKKVWLIIAQDDFICLYNFKIITSICEKNGIDEDSTTIFSTQKPDYDTIQDLAQTIGFFGDRLIVLKDYNILNFNDDDLDTLTNIIKDSEGTHFALLFSYDDVKKIKAKKYTKFLEFADKEGIGLFIPTLDDKYLEDLVISVCKKNNTKITKDTARKIVNFVGKDIGLITNETEKLSAGCDYTEITQETIDNLLSKNTEASVFDIIDLMAQRKTTKAIEKLNILFNMRTDEIAIISALSTGFVDIYRCKIANQKGYSYSKVHKDFESKSNEYRYKKAMSNSRNYSVKSLESILELLLKTDIMFKSTSVDKKEYLSVLITQIIVKGFD